jgi:pimeloyl-ACP methyl ester carboxylesterase
MAIATTAAAVDKPTIALVHGEFESAIVWKQVGDKLRADGYPVIAITLPGRDGAILSFERLSLGLYANTVIGAIGQEAQPVILVGHSFGAMTVSAVAEAAPDKIRKLVYLAAYVPADGDSWLGMARRDGASALQPHLVLDHARNFASVEHAARADLFANDGAEPFRRALPELMVEEPLSPMTEAIHLSAARFGRVDKVFIHTANDRVVSPAMQAATAAAAKIGTGFTLATGHTPFVTDVAGLVDAVEQAAR